MAITEQKISFMSRSKKEKSEFARPRDAIAARQSKEVVIAFSGPIGCGINAVRDRLKNHLSTLGYEVHIIKISDYLKNCVIKGFFGADEVKTGAERYIQMQDAGNKLRESQADILAEHAISEIARIRTEKIDPALASLTEYVPVRTAYIIDQLKHPEEIRLLRTVYGNLFYLFGVLSTENRRKWRLEQQEIPAQRISELMERDRKQPQTNGQQLDKALQLADFFIRNDHANADAMENQIERFVELIHGENGISPTREEYGMYIAYAAGLRSACLSRQVGASIMSKDGTIIATGRNDVPKAGGGLYGPESGEIDARCVKLEDAKCYNDSYKKKLAQEIEGVVENKLSEHFEKMKANSSDEEKKVLEKIDASQLAKEIAQATQNKTRLGGLIEFSRSIHAEMDAIVSLALKGGGSTAGGTLYTYTFPCHNCARHIVAAGIEKVFFLEPYEKSLATQLHGDAIDVDGKRPTDGGSTEAEKKIKFLHFEGVAPRQYLNMFTPSGERKDGDGKAVKINMRDAEKKIPEYLDDYREYELKVVEHLNSVISNFERGLSNSD